jgi:tetratricopeptide (TPR) repeat protein
MKTFMIKPAFVSFAIFLLSGCAAVGVLPTSDPATKIRDAYDMMNQNRGEMAKKFATEALAIYENKNDLDGAARAHSVLGDINRDARGPGLPDYSEAENHFTKAAEIYEKLNKPKWQAFNVYAFAGVQKIEGKIDPACRSLARAKSIYKKAPNHQSATEPFEKGGAFSYSSFSSLEKAFACSSKGAH